MIESRGASIYLGQGIVMDNFMIDQSHGDVVTMYDCRSSSRKVAYKIRESPSGLYSLSFRLTAWHEYSSYTSRMLDKYQHILRYNPKLITLLGPGYICKNCGEYNTSGAITCWRCGGMIIEKDWIRPVPFDFDCATISQDAVFIADDATILRFEMSSRGIDIDALSRAIISNDRAITLPNGCLSEPGYYLCQFCGQAVHDGEICLGCGGWRMPLSEIVKLDRLCKYCGRDVKGSIVCPGCNARIAGTTFKQYLKRSGHVN